MTMPSREIKINCEHSAASAPEEAMSWRSVKISSQNVTCTDPTSAEWHEVVGYVTRGLLSKCCTPPRDCYDDPTSGAIHGYRSIVSRIP